MAKPRKHLKFASSAPREFPLKEIALQAGVGLATVDRVLHQRDGVSPSMRRRVDQAIRELGRQSEQTVLAGRKFDGRCDCPTPIDGSAGAFHATGGLGT